ncbi:MAG: hypothetical protein KGI69_03140 [Patescibacteria group bacterium]|nr:hypothetical protein [Patescibacteria group bacterium]
MTDTTEKELRLERGSAIIGYIRRFSATEKAVFAVFVILAAATALLMAEAVNDHFMKEVPAAGGALHEGLVGLPHTINPVLAVTDADRDLSALVYAGLTRYEDGKIEPGLASSWKASSDGLTYTFDLAPGLSFQDGTPLTAADVVFTVGKIQDPALKSPLAADWANVTATATSPTEVEFILKQPYGSFPANATVGILPKHIWDKVSDDQFVYSQYNIDPIGAGPYKVTSLSRDQGGIPTGCRLDAWNGYAGAKPYIKSIFFAFFPDQDHALAALDNGSIDSLPSVPADAAAKLASNAGEPYRIIAAPLSRVFGVFFNQSNNPVLADDSVRQALSMAVDRQAIVSSSLYGYGVPLDGPLPPGISAVGPVSQPDIAGAQALLEKDGWRPGPDGVMAKASKSGGKAVSQTLSFTLYTADAPDLKQTAQSLSDGWAKIGASVSIKVFDPSDLYQTVIRTRSYDALLFGEAVGRDSDVYAFWHSSERNSPGLNIAMYANSKADKLLQSIQSESDPAARSADYAALDKTIKADYPAIFLYAPDFIYALPKSVKDARIGTMTAPADRWASEASWYMDTERVWTIFDR